MKTPLEKFHILILHYPTYYHAIVNIGKGEKVFGKASTEFEAFRIAMWRAKKNKSLTSVLGSVADINENN